MTEFWWALIGLVGVVGLAWVMNWSRWDPEHEGDAHKHLRPHHRAL